MALNIRNEHVERLAGEVARESGENLIQAIIHSLEERLQRLLRRQTVSRLEEEIMKISKRCSALPDLDSRCPGEILGYDQSPG